MNTELIRVLQKTDCVNCRVGQKAFGDLCGLCYFTAQTNEELTRISEIENDLPLRRAAFILAWSLVSVLCGLVLYLMSINL